MTPQEKAMKLQLKQFGTQFFRNWDVSILKVLVRAYLLEEVKQVLVNPKDPDTPIELIEYHPLVISCVGKKVDVNTFFKRFKEEEFIFPKTENHYSGGTKDCYRVKPFYYRASPEVKRNGLKHTQWRHVPMTMEYCQTRYRPEIFKCLHTDDMLQGYMLGVDQKDAEQGFPRILQDSVVPILSAKWEPAWTDIIVEEIKKQPGWVAQLVGHNMFGYRVAIPKQGLFSVVAQLVKDGKLGQTTLSERTLRAHGIDPASVVWS